MLFCKTSVAYSGYGLDTKPLEPSMVYSGFGLDTVPLDLTLVYFGFGLDIVLLNLSIVYSGFGHPFPFWTSIPIYTWYRLSLCYMLLNENHSHNTSVKTEVVFAKKQPFPYQYNYYRRW